MHLIGTVLGRANYANYSVVYQRCTVGGNLDCICPTFGEGVKLFGGSMVIGECSIGSNCWIQAGTMLMDVDIPANQFVFGQHYRVGDKPTEISVFKRFLNRHLQRRI